MRKNLWWLPFLAASFSSAVYAYRVTLNQFIPNAYVVFLFGWPVVLILLRQIKVADLGIRRGNVGVGLFFAFLLPLILFLRYFLSGKEFILPSNLYILWIGSVAEEFFFRGYLQEEWRKRYGETAAIFLTSFFFALVHLVKGYTLLGTGVTFLLGLYFGVTKSSQGGNSLIYSVAAHSLYNTVVALVPFR